jgi:hypothetical protein
MHNTVGVRDNDVKAMQHHPSLTKFEWFGLKESTPKISHSPPPHKNISPLPTKLSIVPAWLKRLMPSC